MENYLFVSRTENWNFKDNGIKIDKNEWLGYLNNDSDLKLIEALSDSVDYLGGKIVWSKGEIYCVDPDEMTFYKMLEIANTIDASVCGSDGRVYFMIDSYFYPENVLKPKNRAPLLHFEKNRINKRLSWWRRFLKIGIIS